MSSSRSNLVSNIQDMQDLAHLLDQPYRGRLWEISQDYAALEAERDKLKDALREAVEWIDAVGIMPLPELQLVTVRELLSANDGPFKAPKITSWQKRHADLLTKLREVLK